jgi:hypothetical protein
VTLGGHWLGAEELDFMSSLLRWLESHEKWPEGLTLDIKVGLDYAAEPAFEAVTEDLSYWFMAPIKEENAQSD